MILRLAERARRFETEEEKVLPFYASSLTEEEAANVAAAIEDPPSHKLAKVSDFLHFSSFPQVFPIIWGRRNGYEYNSSTLSCLIVNPTFFISLLHKSFHLVFCIPLCLLMVLVHLTFLFVCTLRPFS